MFRKSKLNLLVATSLATSAAALQPAYAGVQASVTPQGFGVVPIVVIAGPNKKWNSIQDGIFPHHVWVSINAGDGEITSYRLRQGIHEQTLEENWAQEPWTYEIRYGKEKPQKVAREVIVPGKTSKLTSNEKLKIIAGCNEFLDKGGTVHKSHSFYFNAPVQMLVGYDDDGRNTPVGTTNVGGNGGKWVEGYARVKVNCKGRAEASPNIANKEPDFKLKKLEMFLSTFSGNETQPDQFHECKRGRILVRATTSKAGPVKFRLWSKVGNGPIQNEVIDAYSKFDGNSKYKVDIPKWVTVETTSHMQARVEEIGGGTFAKEVGWKGIKVPCVQTGSGGNLAGNSSSANPDNASNIIPLKVEGKIHLLKKTKKRADGSREGKVKIQLVSNKKGTATYRLTCDGRNWTGKAKMFKRSNGKYRGNAVHRFRFNKTTDMGCALRSTSMSGDPVIALATRTYHVAKVNPDVNPGGKGQFKDKPRPNVSKKTLRGKLKDLKRKKHTSKKRPFVKKQRQVKKQRKFRLGKRQAIKQQSKRRTQTPLLIVK